MTVSKRKVGNYGYVTINNPPVNAIGQSVRQGLLDAVQWAEDERLERVILTGEGSAFAAGADAKEFDHAPQEPHLPDVYDRIEQSHVHWIAAINGVALGGGAELALACRYRVMHPKAKIGFPEVTLGVVPGAGGTQRLARLVGSENALDLIPSGRAVSAQEALDIHLVQQVDENPIEFAEQLNSEWLGMAVPVGELNVDRLDDAAYAQAKEQVARKMRGQIAPLEAIDLIKLAVELPLGKGLAEERKIFLKLRSGDQAKALRHMFFAERAAKMPDELKGVKTRDVKRAVVVGGGTMGAGIAYALMSAEIDVTIIETDEAGTERARENVGMIIEASRKRGLLDDAKAKKRAEQLTVTTDYAECHKADLAIEAAYESMDVKKEVLGALETHMPKDTVIATNTSYLNIDDMAQTLSAPSRLIGLHFFAPAYIMKLLEIVQGAKTSTLAMATGFALAKTLRKIPVVSGVCDGFIGNRILARYREAADTILMDGSTPWDIDEAMVEFGYAMGPYETQDLSGLDIAFANRRRQDATRDPARRYIPIGDRMVNEGRLGRKTSVGWYRYPGGGGKVIDPLIEDLVREEAHFAKVERRQFTHDEICERLLLAMINEGAEILREGIARKSADIDIVSVNGYGFPRWRGGLMFYADTLGPKTILQKLNALSSEDALVWKPSPMIEDCVARGISIADWRKEG